MNDNFSSFQGWILNNNMGISGTGLKGGWTPAALTTWCVSAWGRFGDAIATTFGTSDGGTARQDAGRLIGLGLDGCITIQPWTDWTFSDVYVRDGITAVAGDIYRIRSSSRQARSQQMDLFHASAEVAEMNARINISRNAQVDIAPNGFASYGIGPFDAHEEIRITNLEVEEIYAFDVLEPGVPTSDPVFSVVIEGDPQLRNDSVAMDIEWFEDGFDYVFVGHDPDVVVSTPKESDLVLPGSATLHLQPAYPNPFGESTQIRFTLTEAAEVRVSIFDAQGRRVRSYAPESRDAGLWTLTWDGTSDEGFATAPGVYFYRVEAGDRAGAGGKLTRLRYNWSLRGEPQARPTLEGGGFRDRSDRSEGGAYAS